MVRLARPPTRSSTQLLRFLLLASLLGYLLLELLLLLAGL